MKTNLHINRLEELDQAVEVSIRIFEPTAEKIEKFHSRDDWKRKIENKGLLITAWDEKKIIGFSVGYPEEDRFHIWNVGVLKECRKQGVWRKMHDEILKQARGGGYKNLSLNTFKSRFPGMYGFVLDNGYEEYKTEGEKSFFIKKV